jgi:hypothetical protein
VWDNLEGRRKREEGRRKKEEKRKFIEVSFFFLTPKFS